MSFDRRDILRIGGGIIAGIPNFSGTARTEARYPQSEDPNNPSSNWPMFRGDKSNTGWKQAPGPEELERQWLFSTGRSIYASPTVRDDLVCIGSLDGTVYGLT